MAIKNKSISFGHGAFWRSIPVLALAAALVYGAGDLVEKGQALNALTPQVPVLGWCLWVLVAIVVWLVFLQPVVQFLRLRTLQDAHPRQLLKDARRRMLRLQRIDPTSGAVSQCLSLINAALQCDEEDAVLKSAESTPAQKLACLRRCVRRMQQTGGDEDAWRSLAEKLRKTNDAEALLPEYERLRLLRFPQLSAVRTKLENDYAVQRPALAAQWKKLRRDVNDRLKTTPAADLPEFTELADRYLGEMSRLSEALEAGDLPGFSAAYGSAREEMNRLAAEMGRMVEDGFHSIKAEIYSLQMMVEAGRLSSPNGGESEGLLREAEKRRSLYEPDPKLRTAFRSVEAELQKMEEYAEGVTLRRVFCEYRCMSGLEDESRCTVMDYAKIAAVAAVFSRGRLLPGLMILLVQVRMVVALAKMHGYRPSVVFNVVCLIWVLFHAMITAVFVQDAADSAGEAAADALSGMADEMLVNSDEAVKAGMQGGTDAAGGTIGALVGGATFMLDGGISAMIAGALTGGATKTLVKGGVSLLIEATLAGAGVYVTGRVFLRQLTGEAKNLGFRTLLELRREGIREMLSRNSSGIASAVSGVFTTGTQKAVNTVVNVTKKTVNTVLEGTKNTVGGVITNSFKKMKTWLTRH
ncbi:MAG: hypothetical protein MSQ05_05190 [Akkermansia sp.]|nr:hypothetical protein [Akkermansia sp.]